MYNLILTNKAKKQLSKLDQKTRDRIGSALERSKIRPQDYFQRLVGNSSYRLRVGEYRIIADIYNDELIILVIEIGHRKNIYKSK